MKRAFVLSLFTLLVGGMVVGHDVLACGDKVLSPGRGTRYQRAPADRRAAAVLLYVNPASQGPQPLAKVPAMAALQKAGYRPTIVANGDELEQAMARDTWELVLVDLADAEAVITRLRGPSAPVVLPVAHEASGATLARARKQFGAVLKSPAKSQALVDAVDDAIFDARATRAKAAKAAAKTR